MIDSQDPKLLFVYGTLSRRANPHAHRWGGTVKGIGTIRGLMYDHGAFPAVVPHPDGSVVGEVITFEDESDSFWLDSLRNMDVYEGVPHLYQRDLTIVKMEDGAELVAWVYYYASEPEPDLDIIPTGDWAHHTAAERKSRRMRLMV